MIVDSSAIVAILMLEAEAALLTARLVAAKNPRMSTATYVELVNVVDRHLGGEALAELDHFLDRAGIGLVAFTPEQARWARHARLTYGVGRHPAGLNFGDCFSYALARDCDEPLLFKGGDFALTDIRPAA